MATYKVIQDIEAEDKFVGPLTLKQFVFAMFGALFGYLSFIMIAKHILFGLTATLPPMFFGFFMAFPWSSQQPTDVWVLAKIRFRIKPKRRIWDQVGLQQLVTITVPKKENRHVGNGLSQTEVRSRLRALADTLDSRGWIIKNTSIPSPGAESSRLVDLSILPPETPEVSAPNVKDMLKGKPALDEMIKESGDEHMFAIYDKLDQVRNSTLPEAGNTPPPTVAAPSENIPDEIALSRMLKNQKQAGDVNRTNMHSIPSTAAVSSPATDNKQVSAALEPQDDATTGVEKAQASVTEQPSPDILKLAHNNDLNVATIARQVSDDKGDEDKEVVISLH